MPNVQDLVNQRSGQIVNIDGSDAGQCTAIVHAWEAMLGLPLVLGNAINMWGNAPTSLYVKVLNAPTNYPVPGDIVVYEPNNAAVGTGPLGHIGVCVRADVNTLDVFEQNDEPTLAAHIQHRSGYAGIKGWLHPKVLDKVPAGPPHGTVIVTARPWLNLRTEPTSQSALATGYDGNGNPITHLPYGAAVTYVDVVQGEQVGNSNLWLKSVRGHYFWSGGTNYKQGLLSRFLVRK